MKKFALLFVGLAVGFGIVEIGWGAMGTGFTYQGRLMSGGSPSESLFDFEFRLYDRVEGGTLIGRAVVLDNVGVVGGYFTVVLDFGKGAFNGERRWLEVAVARSDVIVKKTVLKPRQAITPVPYAMHALEGESSGGYGYVRRIVVNSVSGLSSALAGISGADEDHRYVIKLEPGLYDFGTGSLQMREFVDIEGSGEDGTVLTSLTEESLDSAIVMGADNAELRNLSIHMQPYSEFAVGLLNDGNSLAVSDVSFTVDKEAMGGEVYVIFNRNGALLRLNHVTIDFKDLEGGFDRTAGILNIQSDLEVYNSKISIWYGDEDYGILNESGWFVLEHTDIEVRRQAIGVAILCYGSIGNRPVVLRQCAIVAKDYAIRTDGSYTCELNGTSLEGRIDVGEGKILASEGVARRVEYIDPSPNTINGFPPYEYNTGLFAGNHVKPGAHGGTIGGGGGFHPGNEMHVVTDHFGTIAGGRRNEAGNNDGSYDNTPGAAVGGGAHNTAGGAYSIVPGGYNNKAMGDYSFAAGQNANALHEGAFVWGGNGSVALATTAANQFLMNAEGGLGINTVPTAGDFEAVISRATKLVTGTEMVLTAGTNMELSVGNDRTETIGRNKSVTVGASHSLSVGQSSNYSVTGDFSMNVGKMASVNVGDSMQVKVGKSNIAVNKDGDISLSGSNVRMTGWDSLFGVPTGSIVLLGDRIGMAPATKGAALDLQLASVPALSGKALVLDSEGRVGVSSSSRRYKTDIESLNTESDAVLDLEPVRFRYKESGQEDVGLIAEQVAEHITDLVIYDNQGKPEAVKYDRLGVYLLEVVKGLRAENEQLKKRIEALEQGRSRM